MTFIAVIPARYSSTRLPGKPLALIGDKPMIQHVWERAQESSASRVLVATDDDRVADACAQFSAECLMTRPDHETGTDRLAEVAAQLGHGPFVACLEPKQSRAFVPQLAELFAQIGDLLARAFQKGGGVAVLDLLKHVLRPGQQGIDAKERPLAPHAGAQLILVGYLGKEHVGQRLGAGQTKARKGLPGSCPGTSKARTRS